MTVHSIAPTVAGAAKRAHCRRPCGLPALALILLALIVPGSALRASTTMRLHDVYSIRVDVAGAIEHLRNDYHLPISFIDAGDGAQVSLHPAGETALDVLHQILMECRAYRLAAIGGHWIVYPDRPLFRAIVDDVRIGDLPRLQAADRLIDHLKVRFVGLDDLVGTVLKGDPDAPLFTTRVMLPGRATVLQEFVALLGDDSRIAFSIQRTRSGKYVFFLDTVDTVQ